VPRATVLPDTNVWRYIVDAEAVETVRTAAKRHEVDVVACPAVVYECLRLKDTRVRRALAKALTRTEWLRPFPEAYLECEELRKEIAVHRPDWLVPMPDLREWNRQRSDWMGGFWRRVREQTPLMARIVGAVGDDDLGKARGEARGRRSQAMDLGHTTASLRLDAARAYFTRPVPGWDGTEFDAWRGTAQATWWNVLFANPNQTMLDWLAPWVDLRLIRADRAGWVAFWTHQARSAALPREWIRWAMLEIQALRTVTSGTPVDNQIAAYLPDFDVFVTGDKAFADCIEALRPHAPTRLARVSVSPAGAAAVDHVLELVEREARGRAAAPTT
jgi:hypothetical protein